jgi:hypothetical protein
MSHVLEHFYEPLDILERLQNSKVQNIYLNFPDLESYVQDGTYHVLNPEHTFYVENQFLIDTFKNYGFELVQRKDFERHSVFLQFRRNQNIARKDITNINSETYIDNYYTTLKDKISTVSKQIKSIEKPVYLWPCSMHSIYLFTFGLDAKSIAGFADNSLLKIGKYLYGYSMKCYALKDIEMTNCYILKNGGCFDSELEDNDKYLNL